MVWGRAVLIMTLLIFSSLTLPSKGRGLTCATPLPHAVVLCDQGRCTDGFIVDYTLTGHVCQSLPVVARYRPDLNRIADVISGRLSEPALTGVFELRSAPACLTGWTDESCQTLGSVERLSSRADSGLLEQHRLKWLQKERDTVWRLRLETWTVAAVVVGAVTFAILWPWFITRQGKPRHGSRHKVIAVWAFWHITLAALLFLISVFAAPLYTVADLAFIGAAFFVVAALVEFAYVLRAIVKSRAERS